MKEENPTARLKKICHPVNLSMTLFFFIQEKIWVTNELDKQIFTINVYIEALLTLLVSRFIQIIVFFTRKLELIILPKFRYYEMIKIVTSIIKICKLLMLII